MQSEPVWCARIVNKFVLLMKEHTHTHTDYSSKSVSMSATFVISGRILKLSDFLIAANCSNCWQPKVGCTSNTDRCDGVLALKLMISAVFTEEAIKSVFHPDVSSVSVHRSDPGPAGA